MNKATIFSRSYQIFFAKPVTKTEASVMLKSFVSCLGKPLAHNGIILGHIKVLAKYPGTDEYLFLSQTRVGEADIQPSPGWFSEEGTRIDKINMSVNVLIFDCSLAAIEKVVNDSFRTAGMDASQT